MIQRRLLFAVLLTFLCPLSLWAQYYTSEVLGANNVRALITSNGALFYAPNALGVGYEVPKGSAQGTIHALSLWMGAYMNSKLHIAVQESDFKGQDFYPGPIDPIKRKAADPQWWNHVWHISRETVDYHRQHYKDYDYQVPEDIRDWPAHLYGDSGSVVAPFMDLNLDGRYQPEQGDYPIIKGDEAIYFIYNDAFNEHYSGTQPMVAEVHGIAYIIKGTSEALDNTVFLHYTIVNRSGFLWKNFLLGVWTQFSIGNPEDDYVGTDSLNSYFFAYNSDNIDQGGYETGPPAQAVVFLNRPLQGTAMYNYDSMDKQGLPSAPYHYYHYLQNLDREGYAVEEMQKKVRYALNGDPCSNSGHTASRIDMEPGANAIIGNQGPVNVEANGFVTLELALVYGKGANNINSVCSLQDAVKEIKGYYQSSTLGLGKRNASGQRLSLYPNPATNQTILQLPAELRGDAVIQVIDLQGKVVSQANHVRGQQWTLETSALPSGTYLVRLISAGGMYSGMLVKE